MFSGGQEFRHFQGEGLPVATGSQDNEAVALGEPLFSGRKAIRAIPDFKQTDTEGLLKGGQEKIGNHGASPIASIAGRHNGPSIANSARDVKKIRGDVSVAKGESCNKSALKTLDVAHFFLTGPILEWKSLKEVAQGTKLTVNEAYGIVNAMVRRGWLEKDEVRGYRSSYPGLVQYLVAANECLMEYAPRLGLVKR